MHSEGELATDGGSDRPPMRTVMAALRGNGRAAAQLVEWSLPRAGGHVRAAWQEIERRREDVWDEDAAREEALAGNVTPSQTVGALSAIQTAIIRVCAYTPAVLMAGDGAHDLLYDQWTDAVYELIITLHNPNVKWALIGGLTEETRESAADYCERYNRELWGTALALTTDGEITAENFPPETGDVIRQVGEAMQQRAGAGGD